MARYKVLVEFDIEADSKDEVKELVEATVEDSLAISEFDIKKITVAMDEEDDVDDEVDDDLEVDDD